MLLYCHLTETGIFIMNKILVLLFCLLLNTKLFASNDIKEISINSLKNSQNITLQVEGKAKSFNLKPSNNYRNDAYTLIHPERADSVGYLRVVNNRISGVLFDETGSEFAIRQVNGKISIQRALNTNLENDAILPLSPKINGDSDGVNTFSTSYAKSLVETFSDKVFDPVIDVLFVYDPLLLDWAESNNINIVEQALLSVELSNTSFANSNLPFTSRLRGVVAYELNGSAKDPLELTLTEAINLMKDDEGIEALKYNYKADTVIYLNKSDPSATGSAFVASSIGSLSGSNNQFDYLLNNYTVGAIQARYLGLNIMAHEIGHNMGLHHDRTTEPSPLDFHIPYGYIDNDEGVLTVMAYASSCTPSSGLCQKQMMYSSPDLIFDSIVMGKSESELDAADSAKAITLSAPTYSVVSELYYSDPLVALPQGTDIHLSWDKIKDAAQYLVVDGASCESFKSITNFNVLSSKTGFTNNNVLLTPTGVNNHICIYAEKTNLDTEDAFLFVGKIVISHKEVETSPGIFADFGIYAENNILALEKTGDSASISLHLDDENVDNSQFALSSLSNEFFENASHDATIEDQGLISEFLSLDITGTGKQRTATITLMRDMSDINSFKGLSQTTPIAPWDLRLSLMVDNASNNTEFLSTLVQLTPKTIELERQTLTSSSGTTGELEYGEFTAYFTNTTQTDDITVELATGNVNDLAINSTFTTDGLNGNTESLVSFTAQATDADEIIEFRFLINGNPIGQLIEYVVTAREIKPEVTLDIPSSPSEGETFNIQANATDLDGEFLSYHWTQLSGPAAQLSGITTSLLTITNAPAGDLRFQLDVTDSDDLTTSPTFLLIVQEGVTPTVTVSGPSTTTIGSPITLSAITNSNEVEIVDYNWTQLSGPSATLSANGESSIEVIANEPGEMLFKIEVASALGKTSSSEFLVSATAHLPTVDIEPVDQILEGESFELVATANTNEVEIVSYEWKQVSGTPMSLVNTDQATLLVNAAMSGQATFQVTIVSIYGDQATQTINISVQSITPVLTIDAPSQVTEGDSVEFVLDVQPANLAIESIRWEQTGGTPASLSGTDSLTLNVTNAPSGTLAFAATVTAQNGTIVVATTSISVKESTPNLTITEDGDSGGGSVGWMGLLLLGLLKRRKN